MKLILIDYGSGNLRSAEKALAAAAAEAGLSLAIEVTGKAEVLASADRVVLPGVGAFADCMAGLMACPGLIEALEDFVQKRARPFLGICVGLQLMAERGLEHGPHPGLGWIKGEVRRLEPHDKTLKVPHMGWNELTIHRPHALLGGLPAKADVYFVHSYAVMNPDPADLVATTDYGGPVTAMIAKGNLAGVQFHPEKSQKLGLRLLQNFLKWKP